MSTTIRLAFRSAFCVALLSTPAFAQSANPALKTDPSTRLEVAPTPPGGKGQEYSLQIQVAKSMHEYTKPPKLYPTRVLTQFTDFKPQPIPLDKWGGRADKSAPATGFFYTKKIGDRWWAIDPDGHPYFHQAVVSVALSDKLPAAYASKQAWAAATHDLLLANGFHGTGAWSDVESIRSLPSQTTTPLAYTVILNLMSNYGHNRGGTHVESGHAGYLGDVIFTFDPGFAAYVDKSLKAQLPQLAKDPALFGYFSDNEMPINESNLDHYLALPKSEPGYLAAKKWLDDQHATAPTDDLRKAFLAYEIETYARLVTAAIHKYDPNHMYLGSRFCCKTVNEVEAYAAMGKYADAISLNYYNAWTPDSARLATWATAANKPILVTEWYAKGMDSGLANTTGAGFRVATQADRGAFYQNFVLGLIQSKNVIGWHWFKYLDNDPSDTHVDPSNIDSNKGILDIRFKPYAPLLDMMKPINLNSYALADYFDKRGD